MRSFFLLLFLFIANAAPAQGLPDTMNVAANRFVRYNSNISIKSYTVRIVNDSVLTVYDSTGTRQDFRIISVVVAMTAGPIYTDRKMEGDVLPQKLRALIDQLEPGAWLCFDQVVAEDKNGKRYAFYGEKWVKK